MDKRAICLASDEFLNDVGIVARGDILALRAFADSRRPVVEEREKRKALLAKKLLLGRKKASTGAHSVRKKAKAMSKVSSKVKSREVKLAWQHNNGESKRYIMVRESTGEGQRQMLLPYDINIYYSDTLTSVIDLLFPKGQSPRGQVLDIVFNMGNFNCECIAEEGFSLKEYINTKKLTNPRLYLLSRQKVQASGKSANHDDDDALLNKSVFDLFTIQPAIQPVFSSTPVQEAHHDSFAEVEVTFGGRGLVYDPGLLDDTVIDLISPVARVRNFEFHSTHESEKV